MLNNTLEKKEYYSEKERRVGLCSNQRYAFLNKRLDTAAFLRLEIHALIIIQFLTNAGYVTTSITYVFDLVNIALLMFSARKVHGFFREHNGYSILLICYCILAIGSGLGGGVSPLCIGWELVSQIRVPLFIVLASTFWTIDDLTLVLRFLYKIQPLNVLASIVEYFAFNLTGDSCGGLFGTSAGSNMLLNMYLIAVCTIACCSYLSDDNNKVKDFSLALTFLASFFVATLAEIKFFYFEAVVIVFAAVALGKKSAKLVIALVLFVAACVVGLVVLSVYFPDSFEMLFDVEKMLSYDDGSNVATSGYGISRVGAISQIDSLFFHGDIIDRIVGYGFGSATMSSIDAFCSPFYWAYGWLRYYYSPIAMLYLQNGYIGLAFYLALMVMPCLIALRNQNAKKTTGDRFWLSFTVAITLLFIMNCFYNASSRSYAAILWAAFFTVPFVALRKRVNDAAC